MFFNYFKISKHIAFTLLMVIFATAISFGKSVYNQSYRNNVLIITNIIEDEGNLETFMTRAEFSKLLIKTSEYKDKINDTLSEAVCTDVDVNTPYASYIKKAIDSGYMFTYLGGLFKPYEFVTYSDLTRGCLALLGYENSDFKGNQVAARNLKFESLGLSEEVIIRNDNLVYKVDIINALYNTLKSNIKDSDKVYALNIFEKMIMRGDGELSALDIIDTKVKGPFIINSEEHFNEKFGEYNSKIYLNGIDANTDTLKSDLNDYGYLIIYYHENDNTIYAYSERADISSPVTLKKGYIQDILYNSKDFTLPYCVYIDEKRYSLASEEMKFSFSHEGKYNTGDRIVFLCNKINDTNTAYIDKTGKIVNENDDVDIYYGSIITAFKWEQIK